MFTSSKNRRHRRGRGLWLAAVLSCIAGLTLSPASLAEPRPAMTVYKHPDCGCCGAWIDHLEDRGFTVTAEDRRDMAAIKQRFDVPRDMQSCHTAVIDDYVIEGHVPAADIHRLLAERPEAHGLAVPGMPIGSPGMEMGDRSEPYQSWLFTGDAARPFASHGDPGD